MIHTSIGASSTRVFRAPGKIPAARIIVTRRLLSRNRLTPRKHESAAISGRESHALHNDSRSSDARCSFVVFSTLRPFLRSFMPPRPSHGGSELTEGQAGRRGLLARRSASRQETIDSGAESTCVMAAGDAVDPWSLFANKYRLVRLPTRPAPVK